LHSLAISLAKSPILESAAIITFLPASINSRTSSDDIPFTSEAEGAKRAEARRKHQTEGR